MKRTVEFPRFSPGFTLVELMAAIAIALVLLIGIGMVFRTAGDAIETGQALGQTARANRGVYETFSQDFANIADDGPMFAIVNYQNNGYTDQADYYAANTTTGNNGNGTTLSPTQMYFDPTHSGNPQQVLPALYNAYSHRQDTISFFVRGNYARQTTINNSNPDALMDTTVENASDEAWVTYGLMAMADNTLTGTPNYMNPGQGTPLTNPNNGYGVQWTLGRTCILLRTDAGKDVNDVYLPAPTTNNPTPPGIPLAPLAYGSPVSTPYNTYTIEAGLTDLANTSIASFTQQVLSQYAFFNNNTLGNGAIWGGSSDPDDLLKIMAFNDVSGATITNNTGPPRIFNAQNWYTKPLNGLQMSQMAFRVAPGVSQFIVEYAGDYLNQNPINGNIINIYGYLLDATNKTNASPLIGPTDGQIDFIVDTHPDGSTTRRIRWYGMPRDVAGDPNTNMPDAHIPSLGAPPNGSAVASSYIPDVVPLRDLIQAAPGGGPYAGLMFSGGTWDNKAEFEVPQAVTSNSAMPADYANSAYTSTGPGPWMNNNGMYACVWGPNDPKPKMIRITIVLNDPNRRLHDGQTLEYIFVVP